MDLHPLLVARLAATQHRDRIAAAAADRRCTRARRAPRAGLAAAARGRLVARDRPTPADTGTTRIRLLATALAAVALIVGPR